MMPSRMLSTDLLLVTRETRHWQFFIKISLSALPIMIININRSTDKIGVRLEVSFPGLVIGRQEGPSRNEAADNQDQPGFEAKANYLHSEIWPQLATQAGSRVREPSSRWLYRYHRP